MLGSETPLSELLDGITLQELERDPYPFYAHVQPQSPLCFVPGIDAWLATGYREVRAIHMDRERFDTRLPPPIVECIGEQNILSLDGPRHMRYRHSLQECLAPQTVAGFEDELIAPVIEAQLDLLAERTSGDLVADYFEPISVLSLGQLIGVPELDADTLRHWFHGIILGSSNVADDRAVAAEANAVSREIDDRLGEVFERIDAEPSETIISHLLRRAEGATLAERIEDITPTIKIVIGGGLQEPGHGASTLAYALLHDAEARERFAADPAGRIRPAVEEALRWVSPIQVNTRRTRVDVELAGATIPAGTYVMASLGAANRDPAVFGDDAARFDLSRRPGPHLGFGFGRHFCSGNSFGRTVMRIGVQRLFERHPGIHRDEQQPSHFGGFMFRAPRVLHARWN